MPLIEFTDRGLYCRQGDFYIDPWKPYGKAVITHAHSDHARAGADSYLCHHYSGPLLKLRLGIDQVQSISWNEAIYLNGVKLSLHPAAHIIGSSQVRLEYKGEVWVVTGDFKTEDDEISGSFQPLKCNTLITESTFGLPVYRWKPQHQLYEEIQQWAQRNINDQRTPVLFAYSLGKAQRVIQAVSAITKKIYLHGAIWNVQETLRLNGFKFPQVELVRPEMKRDVFRDAVIIAPPSAFGSAWLRKFQPFTTAICSGWMQIRGNIRRRNAGAGFVISDHADWAGLLETVKYSGAEKVFVTHGYQAAFSRYLNEQGIQAEEIKTNFGMDEDAALPLTDHPDESITDQNQTI